MKNNIILIAAGVLTLSAIALLGVSYTLYQEVKSERKLIEVSRSQAQEGSEESMAEDNLTVTGRIQSIDSEAGKVVLEDEEFGSATFAYSEETLFFATPESIKDAGEEPKLDADIIYYDSASDINLSVGDVIEVTFSALDSGEEKTAVQMVKIQ